jgi:hypothetical protein
VKTRFSLPKAGAHNLINGRRQEYRITVLTVKELRKQTQNSARKLWTSVSDYIKEIETLAHLWTSVSD